MENDIVYGLSEISLYLSNTGKEDFAQTIEDACKKLELLTEQEPVKPILSVKDRCYYCGNCDETEVKTYDHYCPRCGRKVKWE